MRCLKCGRGILVAERFKYHKRYAAVDYPKNQFCNSCFEAWQELVAVVAGRIERKHRVVISEFNAWIIAENKEGGRYGGRNEVLVC
jgi:hypothetical protein